MAWDDYADPWAAESVSSAASDGALAASWVVSDGWYGDSWWVDDSWWNQAGWWTDDSWWTDAASSDDGSGVGVDVVAGDTNWDVDADSGGPATITVDAGEATPDGVTDVAWETDPAEGAADPGPAIVTPIVSPEQPQTAAEAPGSAEPPSEPVNEVSWGVVSEEATTVVATSSPEVLPGSFEIPVVVVEDPVVAVEDPVVAVEDPVVAVEDPVVAVVSSTSVPSGPSAGVVGGSVRRLTSWIGMFMQGFGGSPASSDATSLADSDIPGRGRFRGRLPFRPAN